MSECAVRVCHGCGADDESSLVKGDRKRPAVFAVDSHRRGKFVSKRCARRAGQSTGALALNHPPRAADCRARGVASVVAQNIGEIVAVCRTFVVGDDRDAWPARRLVLTLAFFYPLRD